MHDAVAAVQDRGIRQVGARREDASATQDAFLYRVSEDGSATIVGCASPSCDLALPACIDGHTVTGIGEGAFAAMRRIERVVCPPSLRAIGARAFSGCARLREIELNEGLESVGEEAFALCSSLAEVVLPSTVRSLGVNVAGGGVVRCPRRTEIRLAAGNNRLFVEGGVIYEAGDRGFTLVDGTRCDSTTLTVAPGTVAIGASSCSQNDRIERVVLPEGLASIGEGAFRGCTRLAEVGLPATLEEIRAGAFSCTAVRALHLPARCVRMSDDALCTGPVFAGSAGNAYVSTLESLSVDAENPTWRMVGGVLCRRDESGGWRAVLCPNQTTEVVLGREVRSAAPGAFAGASRLGVLHIHDALSFDIAVPLLPHGVCERLIVDVCGGSDAESIDLELPQGRLGESVLSAGLAAGRVDVEALLMRYDEALLEMDDELAQARLMTARLASPVRLGVGHKGTFAARVRSALSQLCAHFGMRNQWDGFDRLVAAGAIDASNIADVIGRLSSFGATLAAGYLLDLKRLRFGGRVFDYAL